MSEVPEAAVAEIDTNSYEVVDTSYFPVDGDAVLYNKMAILNKPFRSFATANFSVVDDDEGRTIEHLDKMLEQNTAQKIKRLKDIRRDFDE
jgi:hypothetical protein